MRKLFGIALLLLFTVFINAQNSPGRRLKVFIDCSNTWCDQTFIRTEINIVDFLLDNTAADVHVLITEQSTGSGGAQFQLIFFGQNQFRQVTDTIRFNTDRNATNFETRDMLLKYLKLGLTPYILKTSGANNIAIEMKVKDAGKKNDSTITKDPWNYWVLRVGANGYINADEIYTSSRLGANFAANRVTEELKIGFEAYGGKSRDSYELEDDNGNKETIVNKNEDYNFQHHLIKSLTGHWSYGYEVILSRNTFSNNKGRVLLRSGIEYDIFPYKEVNTKFFTISYIIDARRNSYYDTTLYDKTKETLFGHSLKATVSFNQKWGTISFGTEYHNYFHNWKYFNLSANGEVDIRITGGLSLNIYTFGAIVHDQIYLPKEGATPQEVLTRRRQLASGYTIYTNFGLNYRFGSKLNNFVNPRFD